MMSRLVFESYLYTTVFGYALVFFSISFVVPISQCDKIISEGSYKGSFNNYVDKMREERIKKYLFLSTLMPYPCSHFYFDIKFGDRLYSKEKRRAWPVLF